MAKVLHVTVMGPKEDEVHLTEAAKIFHPDSVLFEAAAEIGLAMEEWDDDSEDDVSVYDVTQNGIEERFLDAVTLEMRKAKA
jgi:hypothetical protein